MDFQKKIKSKMMEKIQKWWKKKKCGENWQKKSKNCGKNCQREIKNCVEKKLKNNKKMAGKFIKENSRIFFKKGVEISKKKIKEWW